MDINELRKENERLKKLLDVYEEEIQVLEYYIEDMEKENLERCGNCPMF
jgi:hypothetical protein